MAITDFDKFKSIEVTSASGTPTISCTLCFKIASGDDSTTGIGEVILDWTNISSQADIGVYDENDNLLDYYFESFDATAETAVIWVYQDWVRDGSVQAKIAYGNGPSDQSVVASTVFDNETNLQAGYLFNESSGDLLDVTSNNNDGTVNGATQGQDGIVGGAYSFDGTDDTINTNFQYIPSNYTWAGWIYIDNFIDNGGNEHVAAECLVCDRGGANDTVSLGFHEDASLEIYMDTALGYVDGKGSNAPYPTGTWLHYVAVAKENDSLTIYINDINEYSTSLGSFASQGNPWQLAGSSEKDENYLDGDLDHVLFYDTALSSDEISAIYAATKSSPDFFSQQTVIVTTVTTDPSTNVTSQSATLNGTLEDLQGNADLDVYFEWGTTTSYGNTTSAQTINSVPTSFDIDISGLTALTTYHYRAVATDSSNYWYGGDVSFYAYDLEDVDETQSEFQNGTLTDVEWTLSVGLSLSYSSSLDYVSEETSSESGITDGSGYNDTGGGRAGCSGDMTFEQALEFAHNNGGRLPTLDEMLNHATQGTGCAYDSELNWTCTKGSDSSEHYCVEGKDGSGTEVIKSNTSTAKVSIVADDDVDRSDPVSLDDSVIRDFLLNSVYGSNCTYNYYSSGNRLSPQLDLSSLSNCDGSLIEWTSTEPTDTSITIETRYSLDNGSSWSSWQTCTSGNAIPGLSSGDDLSTALLECKQTLSTTDTSVTPELDKLEIYFAESKGFPLDASFSSSSFEGTLNNHRFVLDASFSSSSVDALLIGGLTLDASFQISTLTAITCPVLRSSFAPSFSLQTRDGAVFDTSFSASDLLMLLDATHYCLDTSFSFPYLTTFMLSLSTGHHVLEESFTPLEIFSFTGSILEESFTPLEIFSFTGNILDTNIHGLWKKIELESSGSFTETRLSQVFAPMKMFGGDIAWKLDKNFRTSNLSIRLRNKLNLIETFKVTFIHARSGNWFNKKFRYHVIGSTGYKITANMLLGRSYSCSKTFSSINADINLKKGKVLSLDTSFKASTITASCLTGKVLSLNTSFKTSIAFCLTGKNLNLDASFKTFTSVASCLTGQNLNLDANFKTLIASCLIEQNLQLDSSFLSSSFVCSTGLQLQQSFSSASFHIKQNPFLCSSFAGLKLNAHMNNLGLDGFRLNEEFDSLIVTNTEWGYSFDCDIAECLLTAMEMGRAMMSFKPPTFFCELKTLRDDEILRYEEIL